MGLFKDDPPQPPNPIQTAAAQTGTNVSTGVANAFLNNVNQVTPQGSLNYDVTGNYSWADPTTGATYNIPRFTATQSLTPQQQNISNLGLTADTNLAQLAANQSGLLTNLLGTPMGLGGAPQRGEAENWLSWSGAPVTAFGDAGTQQTGFGDAGAITRSYGPGDFSADRQRVEQSLYERMDPQLQRDRAAMEARLADQGIRMGSPAHQAAMDQFNRQLTDTRLGITQTAGAEQQRMMNMAAQRAGFENAAQQQAYEQALGRGTFANQAQGQNFQQAALRGSFYNQAVQQELGRRQAVFNAQNASRQNYLTEQYALRNQPINEITALLSGSQVQQPNFVNTPTNNIANTDVAGLINTRFNQDFSNYKQSSDNFNQIVGGLFSAIGGVGRGMALSDRREKDVGERMATVFAAGPDGEKPLPIYEFAYKDDPTKTRHVGPMAQDVEKIDRSAVATRGGKKYINVTRMGSILKAA